MKNKHNAILETLRDILPVDTAETCDDAGKGFGGGLGVVSLADLQAKLGPGILSYQVIGENGETISWDLESVSVLQKDGELLFSGVVAEMQ